MDKRSFLQSLVMTGAAFAAKPLLGLAAERPLLPAPYSLPALPYATGALEPVIDKQTMETHHGKHHQAYINNLNTAIADKPEGKLELDALLATINGQPAVVRNNAGGHYNHSLFWTLMSPTPSQPTGEVLQAIEKDFGRLENLQEAFNKAAVGQFGSGWAWLSWDSKAKQLFVSSTPNQDNPLMNLPGVRNGSPILALDVWEHAYYLKYQNRRADYVKAWWQLVNWSQVNQLLASARKA